MPVEFGESVKRERVFFTTVHHFHRSDLRQNLSLYSNAVFDFHSQDGVYLGREGKFSGHDCHVLFLAAVLQAGQGLREDVF